MTTLRPQDRACRPCSQSTKDYRDYVRGRLNTNQEVPTAFVEYIYARQPGLALLVFADAHQQTGISDKLHVMREALEARRQGREPGQGLAKQNRQIAIGQQQATKERNEIFLAEHIVSNAIWLKGNGFDERFQKALPEADAELAKLAKHNQWWARLYVAYVMQQHPELRQGDVLQQLSADGNALVSKAALSVKE